MQLIGSACDRGIIDLSKLRGLQPLERKKLVKNTIPGIGDIDLKFTQYIPMMVSDIVYK